MPEVFSLQRADFKLYLNDYSKLLKELVSTRFVISIKIYTRIILKPKAFGKTNALLYIKKTMDSIKTKSHLHRYFIPPHMFNIYKNKTNLDLVSVPSI